MPSAGVILWIVEQRRGLARRARVHADISAIMIERVPPRS